MPFVLFPQTVSSSQMASDEVRITLRKYEQLKIERAARRRFWVESLDEIARETLVLTPREARTAIQRMFKRYPREQYNTEVENWTWRKDRRIEITVRRSLNPRLLRTLSERSAQK